ncbi:hypothetical protein GQ43DRAFT_449648 [Delitschia confertaspora ATCC 74209]|uniref:NIMA interactive protein n=1 Tax=Delitschia confertaspora ATCC 74209 TaxID=1513339 RepID=A0A9P4MRT7_9PLEO|nr:hypothetical protein GQ43DRAFT_449648 [Delitschia confertaspora ATCC 74209]
MDSFNLKTASTYINNLLLARGLLRDGKPIEFAHPSRGEGGKEVTMAQIINLVHDLILKRDRDQEHRESIAQTLRTLRSESTRQTLALEKLQTRNEDLARQLSLAQSQERSARAALRTAESSARTLREEMLRLKTTVQQVRQSCANDIRKRDVQIQRLKGHLTSHQRGNKTGLVGASITITPGNTGMNGVSSSFRDEDSPNLDDPEYSLKQETTEFLTQLSQSLSDENDCLIGLVRSTLFTLRELQGMPEQRHGEEDEMSMIEEETQGNGILQAPPMSYEALASNMDTVLENLKTLLTNPNFVPIEEVESREEEIVRLRAGWEKMETRWRDALTLMDGWRNRMANGGDTINLEELKMGLGLGTGLATVNNEDVSLITVDDDLDSDGLDDLDEAEDMQDPPSEEADDIPEKTSNSDMFKIKLQADQPALRERNRNIRSPRKVAFAPSPMNGTPMNGTPINGTPINGTPLNGTPAKDTDENASEMDLVGSYAKPTPSMNMATPTETTRSARTKSQESWSCAKSQESRIPRTVRYHGIASPKKSKKRLSSPRPHPEERSPKLTVQDKLKVAQAEAEAAAVGEGSQKKEPSGGGDNIMSEHAQQRRVRSSPTKLTRVGGRPRRRKSTLTPAELEGLLSVE